MKTKGGRNWYKEDLSNYNTEFLQEIIWDLLDKLEKKKKRMKLTKEEFENMG